ncbi:MAG TPA: M23 family metallopeptidase, partial [Chitinophagaceae bacterium]|nr:M23 family metallopeptidase [Chitinophagaceae bacterium]
MILLFLLGALGSRAQTLQEPHYPRHYFRDPLEIPMTLAGNFGELREGHFHAGIDIKTEGREGLPVHAAAAGYISQISVSAGGYGNLICITHPNGLITLYGHLSRFFPALASYVSRREYAGRQWAIELNFTPDQFPVIQGQLIGWSGSTGDAAGPHLHFEIRNAATDQALNPLLFGFAVRDDEAPQVMGLAVYDRDRSIYEQDPLEVALKKEVGSYVPATGLIRTPALHAGFGIHALDRQNGTHNIYGIYEAVLFQGDHPDIGFRLDGIAPDLSRYVDAHVDYKTHFSGGPNYQLLFQIPGNRLAIYHSLGGDGTVDLSDGKIHPVRILVKDASGNTSVILFQIQHEGPPPAAAP